MSGIWSIFCEHDGRQVDKWRHYFKVYEKHFSRFRNTSPRVLEIGIDHGGSLQLWKEYFGPGAQIVGVDIVDCTAFAEPQIEIVVADQCKLPDLGDFDIIIDDGSHICAHQSITFRRMWPHCRGVYLIEDCHNGYPLLDPHPELLYRYPWVIVAERPQRIIKGTPSRELRPDEIEARAATAKETKDVRDREMLAQVDSIEAKYPHPVCDHDWQPAYDSSGECVGEGCRKCNKFTARTGNEL